MNVDYDALRLRVERLERLVYALAQDSKQGKHKGIAYWYPDDGQHDLEEDIDGL